MNSISFGSHKTLLDFVPGIDTPPPPPPPLIKITGPQIRMCSLTHVVKVPVTGFPDLSEMPLCLEAWSFMYLYVLTTYEAVQLPHVNGWIQWDCTGTMSSKKQSFLLFEKSIYNLEKFGFRLDFDFETSS